MIRRNTWILIGLLIAALAFAFIYNNQKALSRFDDLTATPGSDLLFTSDEGQPSTIRVEDAGGAVAEISHNASGSWALIHPEAAAADQGLAEAAATQVSTLRVLNTIDLGADVLGLDKPSYVITIGFSGGKTHKLEVGSITPTQSGYYVRLDGAQPVIVTKTSLDALLNLLSAPPYAETPTPSPLPATPTPESGAESTPTPSS